MAENKKQHYVPKFYMRNFSFGSQGEPIFLFNLKAKKKIFEGNLGNQCYENYFYGDDLVAEKAFGMIEGRASEIFRDYIKNGVIPQRFSPEHDVLLTHTLMQHARTKHAAEENSEQLNKFMKIALAHDERIDPEDLDKITIVQKNPTLLPIKTAALSVPIVHDLRFKVLKNNTSIKFITSDNPVVLRNPFLRNRKGLSNIGLGTLGLQMFLPLSPDAMLMFYDEKIYKIGQKNSQEVSLTDPRDIENLNDLQWLNAQENVYFNDQVSDAELHRGYNKCVPMRNDFKTIVTEFPQGDVNETTQSSLIQVSKPEQKIELKLSFVKHLKKPESSEFQDGPHRILRDPHRMEAIGHFQELVKQKKYAASEFSRFIKDLQPAQAAQKTIFDK